MKHLHRIVGWNEEEQDRGDRIGPMFVAAVPLPVPDDVFRSTGGRTWRGRPESAGVLISYEYGFARRVRDRIVPPGRQAIVVAVHRPRVAGRRVRGDET